MYSLFQAFSGGQPVPGVQTVGKAQRIASKKGRETGETSPALLPFFPPFFRSAPVALLFVPSHYLNAWIRL